MNTTLSLLAVTFVSAIMYAETEVTYYTEPVSAHFTGAWELENGSDCFPIVFKGRADLRHGHGKDGTDLPPSSEIKLRGYLIAEDDGEAAIGVGADWWWTCSVNGKEITGRLPSMPEGNLKSSFEKTDWVFLVPVDCGTNVVELTVILGESGLVAIGEATPDMIKPGMSLELEKSYTFFKKNFPSPESVKFKPKIKPDRTMRFRTAQPFPAGLEYKLGNGEWHTEWDMRLSRNHKVRLPPGPWGSCLYRPIQQIYHGGWHFVRGEEYELVFH